MMSKKLDWIQEELDTLKASGLYNNIRTISSAQGAWLQTLVREHGKKVYTGEYGWHASMYRTILRFRQWGGARRFPRRLGRVHRAPKRAGRPVIVCVASTAAIRPSSISTALPR